jgi:hypothetical protein
MKGFLSFITFSLLFTCGALVSSAQNYKIKQTISMNGQTMSSTTFVKGSRKRTETTGMMGMGGDVANIEQCDLKRNVKVSDTKKMYFVEPFVSDLDTPVGPATAPAPTGKAEKGGTVTITSAITDTGERKPMYGLTARHIKTVMTMQSSPDACSQQDMTIESDGWYIDLPAFSCPMEIPRNPYMGTGGKRGCTDRTVVKNTGTGKLGFPLSVTQTMRSGGENGMSFSQTTETLEFSKAALDDALFDIPAGYAKANSSNDLYGRPDYSAVMRGNTGEGNMPDQDAMRAAVNGKPSAKRPGVIRIGVLPPTNRSSESLSVSGLQSYLAGKLTSGKYEGMAVGSESEAKAAGCDYVVTSDLSKLKESNASKFGGILGKVTSTDTSGSRHFDVQVDYKLMSLASNQQVLQSKASAKFDGSADAAAQNVLSLEAAAVLAGAK